MVQNSGNDQVMTESAGFPYPELELTSECQEWDARYRQKPKEHGGEEGRVTLIGMLEQNK